MNLTLVYFLIENIHSVPDKRYFLTDYPIGGGFYHF